MIGVLPPGVRRITIWPSHRNRGSSWGLDWPLVYGEIKGFGGWAVWDRHTGEVKHWFPHCPNVHGWSQAETQARNLSCIPNSGFNNFELDAVP